MPSTSVGNRYAAAVWKFASLLHILPAAGTNSHVHLMRILAQHCAHGGAGRRYSLNLERVSPCHSSCTSPYTRFGNNLRERNDNWQPVCTPLLPAQCTPQSRSNDSLVSSQRPTEPMLYAQPARARRSLAQLSRTLSRNCRNTEPERALNRKQELPHRGCTQRIAIARQSVTTDPSFFAQRRQT